jgi:hypothetical protein
MANKGREGGMEEKQSDNAAFLRYYPEDEAQRKRVEMLRGKRYLTMNEFAECMGKTPATVRRWHKIGILKSRLVGPGDRRLPVSELYRYERGDLMQEREEDGVQKTPVNTFFREGDQK